MPDKKKQPARRYCTFIADDGRPCGKTPRRGSTRCHTHRYKVPGRPSKLTEEISQRIVSAILEGAYLETAAQAAGVNPRTLFRWLQRGDDAEAAALEQFDSDTEPDLAELYEHMDPSDWPYVDFRHALKSTEAFAELELLRQVTRKIGDQPWTAYMTVLERRFPGRWGRRVEVKHDGNIDVGKPKVVAPDSEKKREQIAGLLASSGALDEPNDKEK